MLGAPRRFWGLLAVFLAVLAAWDTPIVFPIHVLVVLLHEFSHGLAALATGGSVVRITIEPNLAGLTLWRGGWRWAEISAGYLGSMAWGNLILLGACRTRLRRWIALGLGVLLVAGCLRYVRSTFGLACGVPIGLALASCGWWLSEDVNDAVLCFIGMTSSLYAVIDLRNLIRLGRGFNDATFFSDEVFPLPPVVWAVLWGLMGVACLAFTLRMAVPKRPS